MEETTMQRRNYYKDDPRWITAKYPGRCHCGKGIQPGERAMYYPRNKKVACDECGRITEAQLIDEDNYGFPNGR
jgi:hypothetical protein